LDAIAELLSVGEGLELVESLSEGVKLKELDGLISRGDLVLLGVRDAVAESESLSDKLSE
jgi:hypothetical protein